MLLFQRKMNRAGDFVKTDAAVSVGETDTAEGNGSCDRTARVLAGSS